ncbi:TadE family type IV pilus minor pilin [Streptomyces sp. SJL17-1]|uniref:TadE family type IV pilus minor pilin n=1 Tax=Streptomyces sp. SJL17-1 TaxID=2967223 RepID=UPI0039902921
MRRSDRGFVTVEAALVLPVLALFTVTLLWALAAAAAQIRCVDAARADLHWNSVHCGGGGARDAPEARASRVRKMSLAGSGRGPLRPTSDPRTPIGSALVPRVLSYGRGSQHK